MRFHREGACVLLWHINDCCVAWCVVSVLFGWSGVTLFKLHAGVYVMMLRCHVGACGRRVSAFHSWALVVMGVGCLSCTCVLCVCMPVDCRPCAERPGSFFRHVVAGVCVCASLTVYELACVCNFPVPNSPSVGCPL